MPHDHDGKDGKKRAAFAGAGPRIAGNAMLTKGKDWFLSSPSAAALAALLLLFAGMSFASEMFLTQMNMVNIARQAAILSIITIGQALVFISGSFDLSVAAIASMSTVVVSKIVLTDASPWWPALAAVLAAGAVMGCLNGLLVAKLRIPPMIATLGSATMFQGISLTVTQGYGVTLPTGNSIGFLGRGDVGPVPFLAILMAVFYIVWSLVARKTKLGRILYALGGNEDAVRLSGISVVRYRILIFMICGGLSAFAGLLLCSRVNSGHPTAATGMDMDSLAAALMGGIKFTGGVGSLWGALCGVLILTIITNGLNMAGINPYIQLICKGMIMVAAVTVGSIKKD
jgi:ribose transport system permease protein